MSSPPTNISGAAAPGQADGKEIVALRNPAEARRTCCRRAHMATDQNHVPRAHVPKLSDPEGLDRILDPEGVER